MQRHILVSLASVGLVGFSLAGVQLTGRQLAQGVLGAPEAAAAVPRLPALHGVVLAVEPMQRGGEAASNGGARGLTGGPDRRCLVVARMDDGSVRRALLPVETELRSGERVRAYGGTLVPRELYRSAPFVPAREKGGG